MMTVMQSSVSEHDDLTESMKKIKAKRNNFDSLKNDTFYDPGDGGRDNNNNDTNKTDDSV